MEPYRMASGEVWGDETPQTPSPLPPDTARLGERLGRRARFAKSDPDWQTRTQAQRDLAVRVAAIDDIEAKRRKETA